MSAAPEGPLRAPLVRCLAALELPLGDPQVDRLIAYLALLQRWNSVYNLTAVREPSGMLTQHLADCLAIITPLQRQIGDREATLLDVGSGGGLPAVVIAIALPHVAVTSVDTVGKKAAFVRQVAGELGLKNLRVEHARVERLESSKFDVVASRAFATLNDFTRLTSNLLEPDGCWLAMKGKIPTDEMAALSSTSEVFHVEQLKVPGLDADRCLVWMRHHPDRGSRPSL